MFFLQGYFTWIYKHGSRETTIGVSQYKNVLSIGATTTEKSSY